MVLDIQNEQRFKIRNNFTLGSTEPFYKHVRYNNADIHWRDGDDRITYWLKKHFPCEIEKNIKGFVGDNYLGNCFYKVIREVGYTQTSYNFFRYKKEIPLKVFLQGLISSPRYQMLIKFDNRNLMVLDRGSSLGITASYNMVLEIKKDGSMRLDNVTTNVININRTQFLKKIPNIKVHSYNDEDIDQHDIHEKEEFNFNKIVRFKVTGKEEKSYLEILDDFKIIIGIDPNFDNSITNNLKRSYWIKNKDNGKKVKKIVTWEKYRKYCLIVLILQRELKTFRHIVGLKINMFNKKFQFIIHDYFSKIKPVHAILPIEDKVDFYNRHEVYKNEGVTLIECTKNIEKLVNESHKRTILKHRSNFDKEKYITTKKVRKQVIERNLIEQGKTKTTSFVEYCKELDIKGQFRKDLKNLGEIIILDKMLKDKSEANLKRFGGSKKLFFQELIKLMYAPEDVVKPIDNSQMYDKLASWADELENIVNKRIKENKKIKLDKKENEVKKWVIVEEEVENVIPELYTVSEFYEKRTKDEEENKWIYVNNKIGCLNQIKKFMTPVRNYYDSLSVGLVVDFKMRNKKAVEDYKSTKKYAKDISIEDTAKYRNDDLVILNELKTLMRLLPEVHVFELSYKERGSCPRLQKFREAGYMRILKGNDLKSYKNFLKKEMDRIIMNELNAAIENNKKLRECTPNFKVYQENQFNRKYSKKLKWKFGYKKLDSMEELNYYRALTSITNNSSCPKIMPSLKQLDTISKQDLNAKSRVRGHVYNLLNKIKLNNSHG
jgi:hypothetical protein